MKTPSGLALGGTILAAVLALWATPVNANNLRVTNVRMRNQDVAARTVDVVFDLSWENSWRWGYPSCTNWDAAWVFLKFRAPGSNAWEHARLSVSAADHTAPGGIVAVGTNGSNGVGVFVYSASVRSGNVSYPGTRLKWNYGSNGYSFAKASAIGLSVQAIEMVSVPEGSFYVGSGGTEPASFTDGSWTTGGSIPFQITGTWDRLITNAPGKLWEIATVDPGTLVAGTLNPDFPSGYNAFYCMKYSITQGQYRDFLNRLTRAQQAARVASTNSGIFAMTATAALTTRNGIRCPSVVPPAPAPIVFVIDGNSNGIPDEANDGMDRVCNYLSLEDGCAYADWAGLRPMTELEFEKACRGTATPVPNEYAWGTAAYVTLTNVSGADGSGTELPLPPNANCVMDMNFPVRVGIWAAAGSTRLSSGASFWGIMDLSGHACERPVTMANATGLSFTGVHGDGTLSAAGAANVLNWPVTTGFCFRGGRWNALGTYAKVSDRFYAYDGASGRLISQGGWRGVRSAP